MGRTSIGLVVGGILQLLWMDVSPVGVGLPFDTTAVAILAIYWTTLTQNAGMPQIVWALLIAVPFGVIFKMSDHWARRLQTVALRRIDRVSDAHLADTLWLATLLGLCWTWLRYAILYAVSMELGTIILDRIASFAQVAWVDRGLVMAGVLLPVAGVGVALELFLSDDPESRWNALKRRAAKYRGNP